MEIRPFRPADEAAVIDLWRRCDLVRPQNDPAKDIRRKMTAQPDLFLVAVVGEAVVGTVMAGYEGHRGWVNYLAAAPDHRRRGVGRALMAEAERRLRAAGCPKINLQVRATNTAVVDFYRALGFGVDDVLSLGKRLEHDGPAGGGGADAAADDEQAIRNLQQAWMAATARGDLAAVLALTADDVVFLTPGRPPFGRAEFAAAFDAGRGRARLAGDGELEEVAVAGDVAYARGRLAVTVTPVGGGGPGADGSGTEQRAAARRMAGYTLSVFRRRPDGSWALARDANLLAPEPAEPEAG
ncbi:MAG: Ribosomal protein acetylase RimI and related acetyltransferase [Phycisphaerales bacterium]|nr:Ribosomal protein acetylase RimI and related acetyltransferase [Phycisphaerales bacterium]